MIKVTQSLTYVPAEMKRIPIIHRKSKQNKASYSGLKQQKQNSSHLLSKYSSIGLQTQNLNVLPTDSRILPKCSAKDGKKVEFHEKNLKQRQDNKTFSKLQKIKTLISDYTIPSLSESSNRRYIYELYRGVKYSLQKLKPPSQQYIKELQTELYEPTVAKEKFLFLDLDQTLIFSQRSKDCLTDSKTSYKVNIRPYTFTFLEKLYPYYEIYIFTAATKAYAEAAISKLNKKHPYIKDYLSRQQCIQTKKGRYIKDLRVVKNRQLKDIVIVDNMVESFGLQLDNGIPILSFDGYTKDEELLKLIPFLQKLSTQNDVRPLIRQKFKLQKLLTIAKKQLNQFLGSRGA